MLLKIPSLNLSFGQHLIINIVLRLLLIGYGEIQDGMSEVQYTDVDYKVVTDGARHVYHGESPYDRHTFRYSPLLAYLMLGNVIAHKFVGKLIFAMFDMLVGVLIKWIVVQEFKTTFVDNARSMMQQVKTRKLNRPVEDLILPSKYVDKSVLSALIWLYNPFTMVIGTRGNGDSITCFLVLLALYFLLKPKSSFTTHFIAGLIHGLSIHFRVYPIIFSLSYYIFTSANASAPFWTTILLPNRKQIALVAGTLVCLLGLTASFYSLYGYEFIYETYLYHFVRKDTRHNFSLYFYMQYLRADHPLSIIPRMLTILPQLIIIIAVTLLFSRQRKTLPFAVFLQTFTFVTFNSVLTSQYFVWFMSIFPLSLWNFSRVSHRAAISLGLTWILTQGLWLLSAYYLEFKGWNTFHLVWLNGCVFFGSNILILHRLIGGFGVVAAFRNKTQ